jgi:hypothetical protein
MDWGVVVALAVVTCLEGVRRVPADALVLRRVLGGGWTVSEPLDFAHTWRLVAWWSPITLAVVLPSGGIVRSGAPRDASPDRLDARFAGCRRAVFTLRVLGTLVLLTIVIGVPTATSQFGTWGFATAVSVALLLSLLTTLRTLRALRELPIDWRSAARVAAPLLWPFTAPRGAEIVLEHAVAGAPPLAVARRLLGDAAFATWVRPQAYDALTASTTTDGLGSALLTLVGRPALSAIVQLAPPSCGSGEGYCARCGRVYRSGTALCADCRDVSLSFPSGS